MRSICSTLPSAWMWSASFELSRNFIRNFLLYLLFSILSVFTGVRGEGRREKALHSLSISISLATQLCVSICIISGIEIRFCNRTNRLNWLLLGMNENFHLIARSDIMQYQMNESRGKRCEMHQMKVTVEWKTDWIINPFRICSKKGYGN